MPVELVAPVAKDTEAVPAVRLSLAAKAAEQAAGGRTMNNRLTLIFVAIALAELVLIAYLWWR